MASTLAQLRQRVRDEIGDEERITGTATGGALTFIIDNARLLQTDDYWNGQKVYIKTTTDSAAPIGETRRVSDFTGGAKRLEVELPFSAAVGAGDTYGIAVFSDSRVNQAINDALAMFSELRPYRTTEPLSVTQNGKRFSPTSAVSILWIDKIEYFNAADKEQIDYEGQWHWDEHINQVEFDYFWGESKTLTLHVVLPHTPLTADNSSVTVAPNEERYIVLIAAANLLLSLSAKEFKNDFGQLSLKSWKQGDVSEEYGDVRQSIMDWRKDVLAEVEKLSTGSFIGTYSTNGKASTKSYSVNKGGEDGWTAPQVFWKMEV